MQDDFSCYFPVDSESVSRGLYLTSAGIETIPPGVSRYPRESHPAMYGFEWEMGRVLTSVAILECLEGKGEVEFQRGKRMDLNPGEVLLLPPNSWHRYRPIKAIGWKTCWLKVSGHKITGNDFKEILPEHPVLSVPRERGVFQSLFENILSEVARSPNSNPLGLTLRALALITLCPCESRSPVADLGEKSSTGDALVDRTLWYIWNHSHRVLDVPHLVQDIGVSRRTLENRFRQIRGRTILEEINRVRVERAIELLENTLLPISEVVHLSGFGSEEAMRKTFLKYKGEAPSFVRNKPKEERKDPGSRGR